MREYLEVLENVFFVFKRMKESLIFNLTLLCLHVMLETPVATLQL